MDEGFLLSFSRIGPVDQDFPSPPICLDLPSPAANKSVYQDFPSPPSWLDLPRPAAIFSLRKTRCVAGTKQNIHFFISKSPLAGRDATLAEKEDATHNIHFHTGEPQSDGRPGQPRTLIFFDVAFISLLRSPSCAGGSHTIYCT